MQSKSTGCFRCDAQVHESCITMTSPQHVESHHQENPNHVQAGITQEAFKSIFLRTGKGTGSIVRIQRILTSTLAADGEHHVQEGLLCFGTFVFFVDEGAWTEGVVAIEKALNFVDSEEVEDAA